MNERKSIFDNKKTEPDDTGTVDPNSVDRTTTANEKKDFLNPHQQQDKDMNDRAKKQRRSPLAQDPGDAAINQVKSALEQGGNDVSKELEEMSKIDPEDIKMAEQLMFRGYAEFKVKPHNLSNIELTICSTSAEEMNMLEEVIFDMMKSAEELKDGTLNLPSNHVQSMRNALFVALSYRGMNKEELMQNTSCYLNTIKKGIIRITELQDNGKIKEADELKESLKSKLIQRASKVKRLATPIIEFISSEKYKFDEKMLRIMSIDNLLPKS